MALVRIGKVVRALGMKGHLGIAGPDESPAALRRLALRRAGRGTEWREVEEARRQGKLWAVRVAGIAGRDAAQAEVGAEVLAEREDMGEAGEGLHFWGDLEGLAVETISREPLGRVTGLYVTGGIDVLVVTGERGEWLLPLAPYVTVEREAGRVVVDPPPGLLELAEPQLGRGKESAWRGSKSRS